MGGSRIATLLALAAAATAGCGGGGGEAARSAAPAAEPVGKSSAGSVVQYADCGDWRDGSRSERIVTVEHLRRQLTPQRSKTAESSLADDRAYQLLDRACTPAYAESLRLYKLYVRMQGFAPLGQ